jgi:arylesterase/paraoxonase
VRRLKWVITGIVVVVIALGVLVARTFWEAGEFKEIAPHFSGECRPIPGVLSSEDITIHPQTGVAFISSDDRRARMGGDPSEHGAIYAFDVNSETPDLRELTAGFEKQFRPHGIGLLGQEDGGPSLFVVNHREEGHYVEIFDHTGNELVHRRSVQGPLMHSPNDVLPVGSEAFYVTNDHGNAPGWGRTLEDYLQLSRSYVLHYDGRAFRVVAEDLNYANGINRSRDGETVYVSATLAGEIYVYDRDVATGDLELRRGIDLGTGVDNIELDNDGHLWLGAHPKLLTFVRHAKDPGVLSPSQVLKVGLGEDGHYRVDEIYLNDGEALSGSSVAAVFQGTLLVGSVFDDRFLMCTLGAP